MSRCAPPTAPDTAPHTARLLPSLLALPALALILGGCAMVSESRIASFGVEMWQAEPSGTIQGTNGATPGDQVDVEDSLDLDEEEVWIYHLGGKFGPTMLDLTWIDLESSGISTPAQDFTYGGVLYQSTDTVQGAIDTTILQIHTDTPAMGWKMGTVGIIAGVDQVEIDSQIGNLTDSTFAQEDYDDWVPVVGLSASVSYPVWEIELFADGEISGMWESISFGTFDGDYLSYIVRTGLDIDDGFKIGVGLRNLSADIDDGNDDIDFELDGLTFFAEMNF